MTAKKPVALVVGAGDGIGGAIARRFAREGYTACVTRRSAEKLQGLVEQIGAEGGQAIAYGSDARKEEDVVNLLSVLKRYHRLFILRHGKTMDLTSLDELRNELLSSSGFDIGFYN